MDPIFLSSKSTGLDFGLNWPLLIWILLIQSVLDPKFSNHVGFVCFGL